MAVRTATHDDISRMVDLSEQKRTQYQEFQPLFWRKAADSRAQQFPHFEKQFQQEDRVLLVHEATDGAGAIDGFIIANLRRNGACSVDDFAVADDQAWDTAGRSLLQAAGKAAQERGIQNYEVVCGYLDQPKRRMLSNFGLSVDRYWYTAAIDTDAQTGSEAGSDTRPRPGNEAKIHVRRAGALDASSMTGLAERARGATSAHRVYTEIGRDDRIVLVCEQGNALLGYAIATVVPTPPVYDPGGATCLVVESVMAQQEYWPRAAQPLMHEIQARAAQQGAVQYVVICARREQAKQDALHAHGLTIASEWYVGKI